MLRCGFGGVFAAVLSGLCIERQEKQHEEDGAHEHEGTEEAEVAHGLGVDEHEAGEGADGGDIACGQGGNHVFEGLAAVGVEADVVEVVQGVVYGDADENGADADDDDGDGRFEQGDGAQGEEPTGDDRESQPEDVPLVAHGKEEYRHDEDECQGDGEEAVFLYLGGVGDSDKGCAHGRNLNAGDIEHGLFGHVVDEVGEAGVMAGVGRRVGGGHEGEGVAFVVEEVSVGHLVGIGGTEGCETLQGGGEEVEGVVADGLNGDGGHGEGEHPADTLHAGVDVAGLFQQGVDTVVVLVGEEEGDVVLYVFNGVEGLRLFRPALQLHRQRIGLFGFRPMGFEGVDGFHQTFLSFVVGQGAVGCTEDECDFALVAQTFIDGGVFSVFFVLREEIGDVFLVVQPSPQPDAQTDTCQKQQCGEPFSLRQVVVYGEEEACHGSAFTFGGGDNAAHAHGGVSVEDSGNAKEGVEDGYAGEIGKGAEVGYPFPFGGIVDPDVGGYQSDVLPSRED